MRQRGFSLLEVLVAFSVLALSLGVLMRIHSAALGNVGVSREQTEALVLAQSLIADATGAPALEPRSAEGGQGDRLAWRITVDSYSGEQDTAAAGYLPVALWEISARVAWRDGRDKRERSITLKTIRAQGAAARNIAR